MMQSPCIFGTIQVFQSTVFFIHLVLLKCTKQMQLPCTLKSTLCARHDGALQTAAIFFFFFVTWTMHFHLVNEIQQTSLKTVLGYHGEYCLIADRKICGSDIRPVKFM